MNNEYLYFNNVVQYESTFINIQNACMQEKKKYRKKIYSIINISKIELFVVHICGIREFYAEIDKEKIINAPPYPESYGNFMVCWYSIFSPQNTRIRFWVDDFGTGKYDYRYFYMWVSVVDSKMRKRLQNIVVRMSMKSSIQCCEVQCFVYVVLSFMTIWWKQEDNFYLWINQMKLVSCIIPNLIYLDLSYWLKNRTFTVDLL